MKIFDSPIGMLEICATDGKLVMCDWVQSAYHRRNLKRVAGFEADEQLEVRVCDILEKYFAGKITDLSEISVESAGTSFQKCVWDALKGIPWGSTVSYAELACRVGSHPRAVARAVGANPTSIFIPCHRVIGKDGSLVGYAGGLDAKAFLLELENFTVEHSPKGSSRAWRIQH